MLPATGSKARNCLLQEEEYQAAQPCFTAAAVGIAPLTAAAEVTFIYSCCWNWLHVFTIVLVLVIIKLLKVT
jgi:hypothetical protein